MAALSTRYLPLLDATGQRQPVEPLEWLPQSCHLIAKSTNT
jgi:hypothetical protein